MSRRGPDKLEAPSGSGSGAYRPALDGVRAVAVIAVIVYHVGARMRGGFMGVDVFFVLSGYLITTLLLRERFATGRVRMGAFWARRARRLLPAVLLLLLTTALVTAASAPVVELGPRRDDMIATLFYFANWHFIATDASYFTAFLGASPLRHMWSLAIEEQFYILWPLTLLGTLYLARGRRVALLAVLGAGIALSVALMAVAYDVANPSRAYFGTETHAFPLLIGATLAVTLNLRPQLLTDPRAQRLAKLIWPVVVGALAFAVFAVDDQSASYYRGGLLVFALFVAAAVWIVEAVPHSPPARLLSLSPIRWIGLISYGLYLWHWPVLVWIGKPDATSSPGTTLLVIAITFAAATLSFYLVERPVRQGYFPWVGASRPRLAVGLALMTILVGATAAWATRIDPSEGLAIQVTDTADIACPEGSPERGGYSWCEMTAPKQPGSPVIATAGDSTSRPLTAGLNDLAAERGWGYVQTGQDGCSFLPVAFLLDANDDSAVEKARSCERSIPRVLEGVAAQFDPDLWIVSDRWLLTTAVLPDGTVLSPGDPERDALILSQLVTSLNQLAADGGQIAVLALLPAGPPVDCADAPISECHYPAFPKRTAEVNELLRKAVAQTDGKAVLVSLADIACPGDECRVGVDGTLIRYDGIHFTATFSRMVAPDIIQRAEDAGVRLPAGAG